MVTRSNDTVTTDESMILWSLSCHGGYVPVAIKRVKNAGASVSQ